MRTFDHNTPKATAWPSCRCSVLCGIRYYLAVTSYTELVAWTGASLLTGRLRKAVIGGSGQVELLPLSPAIFEVMDVAGGSIPEFFEGMQKLLDSAQPVGQRL
jgi:hypothetical protein